ncbi:hypothetical protein [Capnocytophaga cynodegmi]|uniref:hypothetical protein n=1 Tax=Capnocytophaga cynodegmi TaxID=28189 RepID=UPI00385A1F09
MEMLIILVLVIALISVKIKNYKTRRIEEEKLRIEVGECLRKELQNIDTGEPYNYFSENVVKWFKDFKENNKHYILSECTMYNNSSEEAKNNTQIWTCNSQNSRCFYSPNSDIAKKKNKELTFADTVLLQKCKEFLEKRNELFNKRLNFEF